VPKRTPDPLRRDPTRTASQRRAFAAALRARVAVLRREAAAWWVAGPTFNGPADLLASFSSWLTQRTAALTSSLAPAARKLVQSAYAQGASRAYARAGRLRRRPTALTSPFAGGAARQFFARLFASRRARDRLALLEQRLAGAAGGLFSALAGRMQKAASDALARGLPPGAAAAEAERSANRAATVASDAAVASHAEGQLDALDEMVEELADEGVKYVVLTRVETREDGRVCPRCEGYDGAVLTIEEAHGLLPIHEGCVVGESAVVADDALAVMKAHYTGEVVELTTAKGRRLAVTGNHMLLTEHGFLPARFAYEGLKVVEAPRLRGDLVAAPDDDGDQPRIADVFAALAESPLMVSVGVPVAPEHLHGDGRFCHEEIQVVRPKGVLRDQPEPCPLCESVKRPLVAFRLATGCELLSRLSPAASFLRRLGLAADGSMGRLRDAQALRLGRLLHAQVHRLAAVAGRAAGGDQALVDGRAAAPETLGQRLDAHAAVEEPNDRLAVQVDPQRHVAALELDPGGPEHGGDGVCPNLDLFADLDDGLAECVLFDDVVQINRRHVINLPVYDVNTASTVYRVNGLVTSNCRCAFEAEEA
jgi:hypothetical protein